MLQKIPEIRPEHIVVYTAIFGGYDRIRDPKVINPDCRYVLFSNDAPKTTGIWEHQRITLDGLDDVRRNRWCKTHSHELFPRAAWTIYVDGQLQLTIDPVHLIHECLQWSETAKIFVFRHHERDCLYDEADAVIRIRKDYREVIGPQIERYESQQFPRNAGLYMGGFLIRRGPCAAFNWQWWDEICNGSHRDQIALPTVVERHKSSVFALPALWWQTYTIRHQHDTRGVLKMLKGRKRRGRRGRVRKPADEPR